MPELNEVVLQKWTDGNRFLPNFFADHFDKCLRIIDSKSGDEWTSEKADHFNEKTLDRCDQVYSVKRRIDLLVQESLQILQVLDKVPQSERKDELVTKIKDTLQEQMDKLQPEKLWAKESIQGIVNAMFTYGRKQGGAESKATAEKLIEQIKTATDSDDSTYVKRIDQMMKNGIF